MKATVLLVMASLVGFSSCAPKPELGSDRHVVDSAGILAATSAPRMNELYRRLLQETDVDFVVVSVKKLSGQSVSDHANRLFQRWKLGSRTRANRGVLLLVAVDEKLVRLHTSYEMESLLTDAFISQVEHQMMVPYFERNMPGPGLEATAELVSGRIYEKILNKTFDPTQTGPSDIGGFRAGGGGVENPVPLGTPVAPASVAPAKEGLQAEFTAQPTAALAWEKFLEYNRRHLKVANLGIFDDKSQRLLGGFPSPDMAQDKKVALYSGQPYEVREEGDLAAIVFPEDPNHLLAPWFFKRGPQGWQMNGDMYPEAIKYDHLNRWGFGTDQHPYHFAFRDFDIRPGRLAKRVNPGGAYIGLTSGYFSRRDGGAYILSIVPNGPAAQAGLEVGDLVTAFDGKVVSAHADFFRYLESSQPGQTVRISVIRGTLPVEVNGWDRNGQPTTFRPTTGGLNPPQKHEIPVTLGKR